MTSASLESKQLGELQPPRRNRYFYGKLLDALHLSMEQQYGIAAQQQLNRLVLGSGVVCGLDVTLVQEGSSRGLRISAGAAIDGWGRRIIVPEDDDLVPLELTDECGRPVEPENGLPSSLVVSVCYRECETELTPALVPDPACNGHDRCEAG